MVEHQQIAAILKFSAHDLLSEHSPTGCMTVSSPTATSSSATSTDPLLGTSGNSSDLIDDAILNIANHHILELKREAAGVIEALLAFTKAGYALAKTKEGDPKFRILQLEDTCDQLRRWHDEMEVNRSSLALQMRRDSKGDSENSEERGKDDEAAGKESTVKKTTMGRLRTLCSRRGRAKSNPGKIERDAIPKVWLEADRAGSQQEHAKLSQVKSQEYDADVSEANTHDSASERGDNVMLDAEANESEKDTTENTAATAGNVVRDDSPHGLRQDAEASIETPVPHRNGLRAWTDAAGYRVFDWSGSTGDEACSPKSRPLRVEGAIPRNSEKNKELDETFNAPSGSTTNNTTSCVYPDEIRDQQATPPQEIRQPSHTDNWPLVTASQPPRLDGHSIEESKQHVALPFRKDTDSGDQSLTHV